MTTSAPKAPEKLSIEQRQYSGALSFWIGEFGHSSPYSKMQREQEEKESQEQPTGNKPPPKYRLGMGHAFAIAGARIDQQKKAYRDNLARHNFAIFQTRGHLYEHEAEQVHEYLKKRFAQMPEDYEIRVKDLESALESVLKAGLCFSPTPTWPKVTEEDRLNPPLRPAAERYIRGFDTWTYTG